MKHVIVKWLDANSLQDRGWHDPEVVIKESAPTVAQTSGWVLREDENCIVIVSTIGDDGQQVSNDTVIPRNCIIGREEL